MKLAIVGATGMVGKVLLQVLEERNFSISKLIPIASIHSVGKKVNFKGNEYNVLSLTDGLSLKNGLQNLPKMEQL